MADRPVESARASLGGGGVQRARRVWSTREIEASASTVWALLVDTDVWPRWGPTVRQASVGDGGIRPGCRGTVTTVLGLDLPFEVTAFEHGRRWAWSVAGITATDHIVEPLGPRRCRVGFGVPWFIAPYLVVCRLALRRLAVISTGEGVRG